MKRKYRAFGDAVVTVSCVVEIDDKVTAGMSDQQLREEVIKRAPKSFGGIHAYLGNGGDMKIIGVEKQYETIAADEPVEWVDYQKGL